MKKNIILWSLIPILSTLYQLCTKLAANNMNGLDFGMAWIAHAANIPWMWLSLASELASFIIWMQILSTHDLSKAFPLTAISYVMILGISWFAFYEAILPMQLLGSALILAGVWYIVTAESGSNTENELCNFRL